MSLKPSLDDEHMKVVVDCPKAEHRIRLTRQFVTRQSDRSMPKMSFNNRVTGLTWLNGQEYWGHVY